MDLFEIKIDRSESFDLRDKSKAIQIRPTLVVGLGGTGFEVVCRLKQKIRALYGEYVPIRFLVLDTDPPDLQKSILEAHEYVNISGFDAAPILKNLDQFPAIKKWWPENLKVGNVFRGAKQKRPIGRLALYYKYADEVRGKLERQVSALFQMVNHADEAKLLESGVRILPGVGTAYVVSSLCGGTGSGTFIDVGFALREVMERTGGERALRVSGVFTLPEGYLQEVQQDFQKQRIQANAYASMKELDNYLNPSQVETLVMQFSSSLPSWKPVRAPFDEVSLLDVLNRNHERLRSIADLYEMIAAKLFLEIAISKAKESGDDNVEDTLGQQVRGKQRAYGSFAVGALIFPGRDIVRYCAFKHAADIIQAVLYRKAKGDAGGNVLDRVKRFKNENELEEHEADMVLDRLRVLARPSLDGIPLEPQVLEKASMDAEQRSVAFQKRLGELRVTLRAKTQGMAKKAAEGLDAKVREMLSTAGDWGLEGVRAFLKQLDLNLVAMSEELKKEQKAYNIDVAASAVKDGLRKVREAEKALLSREKKVRATFAEWSRATREWAESFCEVEVRECAAGMFTALAAKTQEWAKGLTKLGNKLEEALSMVDQEARRELVSAGSIAGSTYILVEQVVDKSAAEKIYADTKPASVEPTLAKLLESTKGLADLDALAPIEILNTHLLSTAGAPFVEAVMKLDIFEAVAKYGTALEPHERLKSVVDRCAAFASIDETTMGDQGRAIKSVYVGVADRDDPKYVELAKKLGRQVQLVSTGDRNQVLVVSVETGYPAFSFNAFRNYQYYYNALVQKIRAEGATEFVHLDKAWGDPNTLPCLYPNEKDGE